MFLQPKQVSMCGHPFECKVTLFCGTFIGMMYLTIIVQIYV